MTRDLVARAALLFIGALHLLVLLGSFFSPYPFAAQNREFPFAPPSRIHFVDLSGRFHLRPLVYGWTQDPASGYREDFSTAYPVQFFVASRAFESDVLIRSPWRLFGVRAPGVIFLFGSDEYGRDVFSRLLYGGQVSLAAGLMATFVSLSLAVVIGTLAGFYGGWTDRLLMRGGELFLALPWLYLLLAVRAFLPLHVTPIEALLLLILVIGGVGWVRPARLVRGIALSTREREFVMAARGFGASDFYLMRRHILPSASGVLVTQATVLMPQFILAEVTISFLGLGIGEPVPSWGNMLAQARQFHIIISHPWMLAPGVILVPLILSFMILADRWFTPRRSHFSRSVRLGRWGAGAIGAALILTSSLHAATDDFLQVRGLIGQPGGRLVYAQRAEPKTLNPVIALDNASREVIHRMNSDLIHVNRLSQRTEPALAKSWTVSADGLHYVLELRRGVRFSDGHPFDADDVVFTFQVMLDEKVHAPQRDQLILDGKPVVVRKLGPYTVAFDMGRPDAAAERLFDGFSILPRHLLERPYREGRLGEAWDLNTPPAKIAGLGPFRIREYVPGQRIVLERNPYYWKTDASGNQLPYLKEVIFPFAGSEDNQVLRFEAGESDVISRISAKNFVSLKQDSDRKGYVLRDLGPGFEYSFLFFNLNDLSQRSLPEIASRQTVFERRSFRQAVSLAIDRDAMVRLTYLGHAVPLSVPVPPGNKAWVNENLARPVRSLARARELLTADGFSWSREGALRDPRGQPVTFSIITSSGNPERVQMATLIQNDLKQLGMEVQVIPLEFRSLLDRVLHTRDYEACLLSLATADADPSADLNVWLSSGATHLWNPAQKHPATPWESDIDDLMRRQMIAREYTKRKKLFDRVQELLMQNLPLIPLVSPNILVGAREQLENFRPAVLDHYALWNIEEFSWRAAGHGGRQ
jgi:ABC-type transport system substrate-binding protein/ABC-type dipeptide/oligopeptide/nickel transport system permease subunit